ncbi:hypothetical protein [Ralstonia solanacearum]|uniref:hypothetical protein n=1 Tax=Ralstonia solanacearum TaxID=305 RepID=UPI0005AC652F|nr:hypothetical protein [Ralstonia solanacearum]MDC6177136.1 hypothetical protein [Ralstonia solanacearum]MDC6238332.1 hypothetical protein [Ralstonia solanacearum]
MRQTSLEFHLARERLARRPRRQKERVKKLNHATNTQYVPKPVAYPKLKYEGRDCTAYPARPNSVRLAFSDGSSKTISVDAFRGLPTGDHLIIRDEFWDAFGGDVDQKEIMAYLYGM